ncbi:MAG TPA: THUMP domain-containing protein [Geobacteraceae bacterium]
MSGQREERVIVKKRAVRRDEHYFATTGKGLEEVLAGELQRLGIGGVTVERGGVRFGGGVSACYRANLWLRTANRVLQSLAEFACASPQELYDGVRTIHWPSFITPDMTLAVDCTLRDSAMTHSGFVVLKTKDAIVDQLREHFGRRPNVDTADPDLRVNVHLAKDRCSVSLDTSGTPLDRRGYRLARTEAPLRENLAAAIVLLSGWDGTTPFVDPMCGSGTIPIEAAMIAARRAPGLKRPFAFQRWPGFAASLWQRLVAEAEAEALTTLPVPVWGFDRDAAAVRTARENSRRAGVDGIVVFAAGELDNLSPPPQPGTIICNPPYGARLGELETLVAFYRRIGDVFKQRCAGYTAWLLVGDQALSKEVGLRATRRIPLFNGPIECRLLKYELYRGGKG